MDQRNCATLYKYILHRIYGFPFTQPASVVEKESVFMTLHTSQVQRLVECEAYTWTLLHNLYLHRLAASYEEYPAVPPNTHDGVRWALENTDEYRQLQILREWTEQAAEAMLDETSILHRLQQPNCARANTLVGGKTDHPLTPDAPITDAQDSQLHRFLLQSLFRYIRCGHPKKAVQLCHAVGEHHRAGGIRAMSLWTEPNVEGDADAGRNKKLADGNSNRVLARYILWQTTDMDTGDRLERGISAALCGRIDYLLSFCDNFMDKLWAHCVCALEYRLDGRLRQSDAHWQQNVTNVDAPEADSQQVADHSVEDIVHDIAAALSKADAGEGSVFEQIQRHLILGTTAECVAFMRDYALSQADEDSQTEWTQQSATPGGQRTVLHRHLLRFFAHLALAARRLDLDCAAEHVDDIVSQYVQMLVDEPDMQADLLMHYVCELPQPTQIDLLALYLSGVTESAGRHSAMQCMLRLALPHVASRTWTRSRPTRSRRHSSAERPKSNTCSTRFLCTGQTYRELAHQYRVGYKTVATICSEVTSVIIEQLSPEFLPPLTTDVLRQSEQQYRERWQFPNCAIAVDGKHVALKAPANSGSSFFNYKGHHSLVLMAGASADYRFTFASVGFPGRSNDAAVFAATNFGDQLQQIMPADQQMPGTEPPLVLPVVAVADEAFPLKRNMMRPFPGARLTASTPATRHKMRIFNYRLSRARRIIENSFGILAQRFRVLLKPMQLGVPAAKATVMACVVLHNYLLTKSATTYLPSNHERIDDDELEGSADQLVPIRGGRQANFATAEASVIRDTFMDYFATTGALPYQEQIVSRGYC